MKMNGFQQIRSVFLLLLAVAICKAQQPGTTVSLNEYQYLSWPTDRSESVYDNQQHRWNLILYGRNLELQNNNEARTSVFQAALNDSWTGNIYSLYATGTFPPLGLRISADFKLATFYDVSLNGTSDDGSLKFNVSISYADFWTDSPANDLFSSKYRTSPPYLSCTTESLTTTGTNMIQSKGFWIGFHFEDGNNLYFNVPPGASAQVDQRTYANFQYCAV